VAAFRTITARFAGTCKRCGGAVAPGDKIRWAKRAGTYHLATDCRDADYIAPIDFGNGRCEDAPCCGCGGRCGTPLGGGGYAVAVYG